MTEKTDANSFGAALLDRNDGLQKYRGVCRSNGVAFYLPAIRYGGGGQTSGAGRQVRQSAMRSQERAADYSVVLAWSGLLLFIGAGPSHSAWPSITRQSPSSTHRAPRRSITARRALRCRRLNRARKWRVRQISDGCLQKDKIIEVTEEGREL